MQVYFYFAAISKGLAFRVTLGYLKYAIEAGDFGDPFAMSMIPVIYRIFEVSVPAHLPILDWLAEAVPHNTRNAIEDKFLYLVLDPPLWTLY